MVDLSSEVSGFCGSGGGIFGLGGERFLRKLQSLERGGLSEDHSL